VELSYPEVVLCWHALNKVWQARVDGLPTPDLGDVLKYEGWRLRGSPPIDFLDAPALVAKIESWTPLQRLAFLDAMERYSCLLVTLQRSPRYVTMDKVAEMVGLLRLSEPGPAPVPSSSLGAS
jgi:hypothetical protein